jgi:phosphatidylserine decarboxylase
LRIVSDGIYYAVALAVIGAFLSYLGYWQVSILFYALAAFCLYFFRDPERTPSADEVIFSPADGKVVSIRQLSPEETRISIFLNIFNVHVNRAPISGKITEVLYRKGRFLVASHEAASVENEQNTLIIDGKRGRVVCRQIAGLIARRIICYKRAGDLVAAGERIGYIKFGSRVDVVFGPEWKAVVNVGDKVSAGVTVLANPTSLERPI